MFISFLYPFSIRNIEAPYLWIYYKQLTELNPEDIIFIGSKEYFFDPKYFLEKNRCELNKNNYIYNEYKIPNMEKINSYENIIINDDVFKDIENKFDGSIDLIWKYLLKERYIPLEKVLEEILKKILNKHNDVNAILSWCNCPSLQNIADKLNIKIIYNEVGALRPPLYNYMAYFDFSGVNGNTECEKRYKNFLSELNKTNIKIPNFKLRELLNIVSNKKQNRNNLNDNNNFKVGVALQVENDSNILAYSNGFSNFEIINLVKQFYNGNDILIRQHPSGFLNYNKLGCCMDKSSSSAEFVKKCNEIFSINSSVILEGFLFGKKTHILGESPFSFLANIEEKDLDLALFFVLFGYMIPYKLLFNREYYNFRLRDTTSEINILLYHLKFYLLNNSLKYLSSREKEKNLKERYIKIKDERDKIQEKYIKIEMEKNKLKRNLEDINNSHGMKMLKVFYKIRDEFLPYGSKRRLIAKRMINTIYKTPKIFVKEKYNKTQKYTLSDFKINKEKGIVILTTKHCTFIANLLKEALSKINTPSEIIYEMPKNGYKKLPHIVICPQMFEFLPEIYIAYQMEQSVTSRWFNETYFNKLKRSVAIFDYSLKNIEFLQRNGIELKQIYYMPVSYLKENPVKVEEKIYDVIFYGDDSCLRRKNILKELRKEFNIKIINNLFGEKLKAELKKAKIILNIHYYENALLETTRICECLSMNSSLIISETSSDIDEYMDFKDMIELVECNNLEQIKEKIRFYLTNELLYNKKIKDNINKIKNNKCSAFEYYFYRFLLATDNMDFEDFYKLSSEYIILKNKQWCLGLPESISRHKSFDKDNIYDFEYFPGLRHYIGWIGCGLSYKFLLRKAKELNLPYVTICEDDVLFSDRFIEKLKIIIKYLEINKENWHIFSGLMADVSNDIKVEKVENFGDIKFITVNKLISMVYNIYNNNFFDYLEEWDSSNRNDVINTIDRYIESKDNLNIITILPYLVNCKNELNSTLWGFKNVQYEKLISGSEKKLYDKVYQFEKRQE